MPARQSVPISYLQHASRRLDALSGAVGFNQSLRDQVIEVFRSLTATWSTRPIGAAPRWPSDITDDHSPYEISLAVERHRPELRMLVEAQPELPNAFSQWEAARAVNEILGREHGASLDRLRAIEDVFEIESPAARFGMWHAANVREGARPEFKVYLNPHAKGPARAAELVGEAVRRLGFGEALDAVPIREGLNELKYFSLDLGADGDARVKIYLVHHRNTAADIEAALSAAANYVDGEATEFCRAMSGTAGPYIDLPLQSCYSFTTKGGDRPVAATLYFPVRAYSESDEIALRRILDYMIAEDRPLYERALRAYAGRELGAGTGIQTYAAYRRQNFFRRVTVYLSPELYSAGPRRILADPVSGVMATPNGRADRTSVDDVSPRVRKAH